MTELYDELMKHTPLKPKGKNFSGKCLNPACDTKDGFSYNAEKDYYYCFKCKTTGKSVYHVNKLLGLIAEKENITFKGFVDTWRVKQTKNGNDYLSIKIEDDLGSEVWVSSFNNVDSDYFSHYLNNKIPLVFNCTAKKVGEKTFYNLIEAKEVGE